MTYYITVRYWLKDGREGTWPSLYPCPFDAITGFMRHNKLQFSDLCGIVAVRKPLPYMLIKQVH